MSDKPNKEVSAKAHKDLDGFDISVDSFGQLSSNLSIDKLNSFLNDNMDDKKLSQKEEE